MSNFLDGLLNLSPIWIYVLVGLIVFAEDAIFVGFVIPGETAAVLAGVASYLGTTSLPLSIGIVVVAAILGDSVGYEVGKRIFGPRILSGKLLGKHRHKLATAEDFLKRRGGSAVFLGRFTAFFRAMMPALAGASGMRYRTFLIWNAAGGIIWGSLFVTLGHVAGRSYKAVEQTVGRGLAIGVVVIVVLAVIAWRVYESRKDKREEQHYGDAPAPAGDVVESPEQG
ncbi:MAG: DedA family protein [Actinomycetota bacterium]|nr:DedA family protein [Actinomycetota bacterium]